MTAQHTHDRIRMFVLKHSAVARRRSIRDTDQLLEQGIIDSLAVLNLVAYLEQEFEITVSDDDLSPDNFQSIDRLAAFVAAKRNGGQ